MDDVDDDGNHIGGCEPAMVSVDAGLHKKVSIEKGGSAFETKLRIEFGVNLWHGKKKNVRRKWEQTLGRIRADNAVRFITNKG